MNLRKLAEGQDCQIRIPGVCNFNPKTTVLCHLNGAGMGLKHNDLHGAWGCSDCHDAVDSRGDAVKKLKSIYDYDDDMVILLIKQWHYEGVLRTQQELIKMGLL